MGIEFWAVFGEPKKHDGPSWDNVATYDWAQNLNANLSMVGIQKCHGRTHALLKVTFLYSQYSTV